jgi:DNA modification methylase
VTEQVIHGDSLEILKSIPDNSIDSVVTDPPYGLAFMGKDWDKFTGNRAYAEWTEQWARECLRVLKPGGHLLAFSGTRTYHALAWGVESAGFDIRDMIEWLYLSGFPKSMDVGKQMDKQDKVNEKIKFVRWMQTTGLKAKEIDDRLRDRNLISDKSSFAVHFFNEKQPALPTSEYWEVIRELLREKGIDEPAWIAYSIRLREEGSQTFKEREKIGERTGAQSQSTGRYGAWGNDDGTGKSKFDITAPATPLAKQWDGWGTALKPAHEPIVMARKPLSGTVCANVEQYGTGAINVDGCRIGDEEIKSSGEVSNKWREMEGRADRQTPNPRINKGRFPANCITTDDDAWYSKYFNVTPQEISKKASKKDRGEGNNHPTVKPTDLMAWLVRLVTPPNGIVLDPFAGSGSTLVAAKREGFSFIGIEREEQYIDIIHKRLEGVNEWQSNLTKSNM